MKDKQRKARAALEDLRHGKGGAVLAGVDYLTLAQGGRRKATAESAKMDRLRAAGERQRAEAEVVQATEDMTL